MRHIIFLLSMIAFFFVPSSLAKEKGAIIANINFGDSKLPPNLQKSLLHALDSFLGKEASEKNLLDVESFLRSNFIIVKGNCTFRSINIFEKELLCNLEAKLTVQNITINGLPFALLLKSLERRLPLQKGYLIENDDASINKTIQELQSRTASFLKRNGFYDARVDVEFHVNRDKTLIGFAINISEGSFAKVRNVTITGDSPLGARSMASYYKKMCVSFDKIIEAISIGSNCYNVDLERQTTKMIGEKLAQMGYLENNIRVFRRWENSVDKQDTHRRYLDLTIEVLKGPKVEINFIFKDLPRSSQNKFRKFFSSLFAVEYLTKFTASLNDQSSHDLNPIYENDLQNELSISSIRVVDEAEIQDAAGRMTDYLIKKGYAKAEVTSSIQRKSEEKISINFEITAGSVFRLKNIVISPPSYIPFINTDDLSSFLEIESITTNHYARDLINSAAKSVEAELAQKGFKDIKVDVDAIGYDNGEVSLFFNIMSDKRKLINTLNIVGARADLMAGQLGILFNCDNLKKSSLPCQNSSFRPDDLEHDRQIIEDRYQSAGFFYMEVNVEYKEVSPNYVDVVFHVHDRRKKDDATVVPVSIDSNIILSGNYHTFGGAITRLFAKNNKTNSIDPQQIKKGIARMRETGRFSLINQKILALKEKSDRAYLLLQVAEKPSTTFDAIASFSTDRLFNLGFELTEENLFWSMLRLKTSAGLGLFFGRTTYFSNRIIWPRIYGSPMSWTLTAPSFAYEDLTHFKKPARRIQTKISSQIDYRTSATIAPYLKYSLAHTFLQEYPNKEASSLSRTERLRTFDGLTKTLEAQGKVRGVLRPGVLLMALDNPQDPKKGINADIWNEISGGPFLGVPPFFVFGAEGRAFVPVKPFTLAFQLSLMRAVIEPSEAHWREIRNASSMDLLGGDRSVRGYREGALGITRSLGPERDLLGYFLNTANFEIRFPLSHEGFLKNMAGALFIDQGILAPVTGLFSLFQDWTLQELARQHGFGFSFGASLRYKLPIGPLSLDYGYSPIHHVSRVHILFGYSF